ncbi:uncharacterized protein LOC130894495 [Diorhabda carinulata]|uniref:uncharacterized protein LOC130894495 n=1 Tax=Diorhabda carinulata TaxID=1163345 RepID=UPI0025A14ED5|nr:uncharacterized protein LOC130894495 [Diorhabda carinulata]
MSENNIDVPYQNAIGCLMYLVVNSRLDIAYAVSYLSQFNNGHSLEHWNCIKRVFRYLKATSDLLLTFKKTNSICIEGYVDATWGDHQDDRRSHTGFIFKLAGGPISWETHKQRTIALSSCEAEYMAASEACKEAVYLRRLISEVLCDTPKAVKLFVDNQSAIKIAENPVFHNRTKHIDIRFHFIREVINDGKVKLEYKPSNEMIADELTKGLGRIKHTQFVRDMGLIRI